jgi:hypothetical protein
MWWVYAHAHAVHLLQISGILLSAKKGAGAHPEFVFVVCQNECNGVLMCKCGSLALTRAMHRAYAHALGCIAIASCACTINQQQ